MIKNISIALEEVASIDALSREDKTLVEMARTATASAYAPYSHFHVGAAAQLQNGTLLTATNQENASYPVGICAERSLLATIGALHPNAPIQTIAISYKSKAGADDEPVAPCGMCRQSLVEYAHRTSQKIRLLLTGQTGKIWIIENADTLLPLSFSASNL